MIEEQTQEIYLIMWSLNVNLTLMYAFTCAANPSTAVHDHRRAPRRPRPTGAQALDRSLPPLKNMFTEVQHGRRTFGHSKVWPADIEVVAHLPSLSGLLGKVRRKSVKEIEEIPAISIYYHIRSGDLPVCCKVQDGRV